MPDITPYTPPLPYLLDVRPFIPPAQVVCQFFIPRGHWVSATWEIDGVLSGLGTEVHSVITASDTTATPGVITAGSYADVITTSILQMTDIVNAANVEPCGSLLTVTLQGALTWIADLGQSDAVSNFILHLSGNQIVCGSPCNDGNVGPPLRPVSVRYPYLGTWNKLDAGCHTQPGPTLLQITAEHHQRVYRTNTPFWMPNTPWSHYNPAPPVDLPGYLLFMDSLAPTLYVESIEATMAMDSAEATLKMDAQYK